MILDHRSDLSKDMVAWDQFQSFHYKFMYADMRDAPTVKMLKRLRKAQAFKLDDFRSELSYKPGISLKSALELTLECTCQDNRDKEYGVLGIVAGLREGVVRVRYDISLEKLYRNVMAQYQSWQYDHSDEVRQEYY